MAIKIRKILQKNMPSKRKENDARVLRDAYDPLGGLLGVTRVRI